MLREVDTHSVTRGGHTYLYAIRDRDLVFYWSDNRQRFILTQDQVAGLEFLVLHSDFHALITDQLGGYHVRESFPLLYDFKFNYEFQRDDDFVIADFESTREEQYAEAADMLNRCYGTKHHTSSEVASWLELPVFDNSLWFWIRSRAGGDAAGLAISTYQTDIRECYLDWFQVLPEYQGQGLGRLLILETIQRVKGKSDIIRVTGRADEFYQKCGFYGTESWRIISKS
jgi:GNAT superfamily N-acetyltransferase